MTKTTRARIAAGVRSYWKTVHSVQRKTGLSTSAARVVARSLRQDGYTTARTLKPGQAAKIVRAAKRQKDKAYKLTREKDTRTPKPRRRAADVSFDFGANVPEPMPAPRVFAGLDDWIEAWEDLGEDFDLEPPDDYDVTPDYEGKKK